MSYILALLFVPLDYFPKRASLQTVSPELDFLPSLSLSSALQHALLESNSHSLTAGKMIQAKPEGYYEQILYLRKQFYFSLWQFKPELEPYLSVTMLSSSTFPSLLSFQKSLFNSPMATFVHAMDSAKTH